MKWLRSWWGSIIYLPSILVFPLHHQINLSTVLYPAPKHWNIFQECETNVNKEPPPGSDNHLLVIFTAFWSQDRNNLFLFSGLFHEFSCNYTLPRFQSDLMIYNTKSVCSVWCRSITTRFFSLLFTLKQPFNHPNRSPNNPVFVGINFNGHVAEMTSSTCREECVDMLTWALEALKCLGEHSLMVFLVFPTSRGFGEVTETVRPLNDGMLASMFVIRLIPPDQRWGCASFCQICSLRAPPRRHFLLQPPNSSRRRASALQSKMKVARHIYRLLRLIKRDGDACLAPSCSS